MTILFDTFYMQIITVTELHSLFFAYLLAEYERSSDWVRLACFCPDVWWNLRFVDAAVYKICRQRGSKE